VAACARWPKAAYPAVWSWVILAPTSSFLPIASAVGAEHRLYLSLAGPVVLVVVGAYALMGRLGWGRHKRWVGMALLLAVAVPLAWRTVQRNADYEHPVTLWQTVTDARPDNSRAHGRLARALRDVGRPDDAMVHYGRSLELRGDVPSVLIEAGSLLWASGEHDAAVEHFRRALDAEPDHAEAHYQLGRAHQFLRQTEEAAFHLGETLRIVPHHAKAHLNLGIVRGSQGRLDEAIHHFREALRYDPGLVVASKNLELALRRQGQAE
jgi:tetratricopeptide (TPR) repeat protein